ncbi:Helitron helicase, partial [Phytophthora megakarya]
MPVTGVVILEDPGDESLFEPEFLNSLNFSIIPPHQMVLKVGTSIIMICNLNHDDSLCNGTRLRVVALHDKCIDLTIMNNDRTTTRQTSFYATYCVLQRQRR